MAVIFYSDTIEAGTKPEVNHSFKTLSIPMNYNTGQDVGSVLTVFVPGSERVSVILLLLSCHYCHHLYCYCVSITVILSTVLSTVAG